MCRQTSKNRTFFEPTEVAAEYEATSLVFNTSVFQ